MGFATGSGCNGLRGEWRARSENGSSTGAFYTVYFSLLPYSVLLFDASRIFSCFFFPSLLMFSNSHSYSTFKKQLLGSGHCDRY